MFLDHLNGHTTQVKQKSGRLISKTPFYKTAKITSYVATGITLCVPPFSYVGIPSKDRADVLLTTVPSYGSSISEIAEKIATYLECESFDLNKKL